MAFLARGNWPDLMELRVFGNEVCVLGLELLMAGQWPHLWHLVLDGTLVTAASWTLLDLSGPLPDCEFIVTMSRVFAALITLRFVDEHVVWLELERVEFVIGSACMAEVKDKGRVTKPVESTF